MVYPFNLFLEGIFQVDTSLFIILLIPNIYCQPYGGIMLVEAKVNDNAAPAVKYSLYSIILS